jgi:hypothetical protein
VHGRMIAAEERRVLVQRDATRHCMHSPDAEIGDDGESIHFDYLVLACGRFG